jgi:anti-sigma factor ChrR (cupin superfamily)
VSDEKQTATANLHQLASSYALDALDDDEKLLFEAHLRQGCDACEKDVRSFANVVGALGESVSAGPPARLRESLLSRISRTPRVPGVLLEESGLLIARSSEVTWQAMAPGIVYKPLYQDAARKYGTSLVRMEAGVRYPSHNHKEIEELFVLSGDLHVEDQIMRAGDYCRANAGTIHGETFTDSGCLFLLMASQENQVIETRI